MFVLKLIKAGEYREDECVTGCLLEIKGFSHDFFSLSSYMEK